MTTSSQPHLLLIDDDVKLSRLLTAFLGGQGYEISTAHDGAAGLARALEGHWDLIVLDGMLPKLDGIEVLARLRQQGLQVPVLMLTARGDEGDRVLGLDQGADDYVAKTVSPRELSARIRALLRRAGLQRDAAPAWLRVGGLQMNLDARNASLNGAPLRLTALEFDLLAALAAQAGRVLSRELLVQQLRERRFDASDRSIDVHVTALRRKLGDDPREPRYIQTVRGLGYRMPDTCA